MRPFYLLITLIFGSNSVLLAQEAPKVKSIQHRHQVEVGILPFVVINSFSLGYGYTSNAFTEHVLLFNTSYTYGSGSYNLSYNLNRAFKGTSGKTVAYIPFWFRYKRSNRSWNELNSIYYHESWRPDQQLTRLTIGSGFGKRFFLKNRNSIRVEYGLGAQVSYAKQVNSGDFKRMPRDLNINGELQENVDQFFPNNGLLNSISLTSRLNITYVFSL